jgi:AraC-like DNA-binding protein
MLLKSLILAGTAQGVFLIFLLMAGRKTHSARLLAAWLAVLSLQLLFYYDNLSGQPLAPNWLSLLGFALPLLSSPVFYLYVHSLSLRPQKIWPHVLPYGIYSSILSLMPVTAVHGGFPHFAAVVPGWLANLLYYPMAVVPAAYALLTVKELWRLQRSLALSFVLLFAGLFTLIRFGPGYGLVRQQDLFAIVGAALTLYVFFIGFLALRPPSKPRYRHSGLADINAQALFTRLTAHMQDNQPFLKDDLTLDILAAQLEVPPHQLSQAINQTTGSNFFSLVNTYRVEAVKGRLTDPAYANYSIMGIAGDCGFRSKSSFNKIFKEMTGETPSAYQNKGLSPSVRTS